MPDTLTVFEFCCGSVKNQSITLSVIKMMSGTSESLLVQLACAREVVSKEEDSRPILYIHDYYNSNENLKVQ